MRAVVRTFLDVLGCVVTAAASAEQAMLALGPDASFDLVLTDIALVLLCQKRSLRFTRRQQGHRGSVLIKAAAMRSRKVVMDDGAWRCVRWAGLPRGL